MSAIETFIERVTLAAKSNSKEIRFQMTDAVAIMTELATLGSRNAVLADQLIETQNNLIKIQKSVANPTPTGPVSVEMDGGNFQK